jgi:hypothetical protein
MVCNSYSISICFVFTYIRNSIDIDKTDTKIKNYFLVCGYSIKFTALFLYLRKRNEASMSNQFKKTFDKSS